MKIGIIGGGNIAAILGKKFLEHDHEIVQVVNRTESKARELATTLKCTSWSDLSGKLNSDADLFIVAVSDSALFTLDKQLQASNTLLVHTAGSVPMNVLEKVSARCGVFYPLQSLRKETALPAEIPILVDANNEKDLQLVTTLASGISAEVQHVGDEKRLKLHTAAVVVSNFTNHLYNLASQFCNREEVDFKLLQPLIEETATRLRSAAPASVQTGPAIRNDVYTLDKHLKTLSNHPKLKYLYVKLTDSIMSPD